jgi:type IV pilus assembly protein PilB
MIATESDINDFISRYYGEVEIPKEIKKEEKDIEIFWKEGEPITPDVPIVPLVDFLISRAYSLNASDFHLEPRENDVRVRYRIDGVTLDFIPLPKEIQNAVISRIKLLANLDITETKLPQEGRFNTRVKDREVDVRVSIIPTIYGEKVAVKIFRRENSLLKIEELGMSKEDLKSFQEMIQIPYGLVIIAGPTGSGKSTTFYAILEKLNTPFRSIITLEEPVEYPLKNINQVSINPKVGLTYASALQFIFRQIPDIVMIGEIKDKETAEIAIDTALAGTFIVTTINAYDAISALVRLINIGIEPYLLCTTLIGVIAQRLVRILCPFCKTPYFPSEEQIKKLGIKSKEKIELFKPKGCKFCNNTGYKGRTGIFEILRINPEIQNLIMEKSFKSQILEVAKETGFIPLKEKAIQKVIDGITSEEELYRIL